MVRLGLHDCSIREPERAGRGGAAPEERVFEQRRAIFGKDWIENPHSASARGSDGRRLTGDQGTGGGNIERRGWHKGKAKASG